MRIGLYKQDEYRLAVKVLTYWPEGIAMIRTVPGRSWDPTLRLWFVPYTLGAIERFTAIFARADVEIDAALLDECPTLAEWLQDEEAQPAEEPEIRGWDAEMEHRMRQALALRGYSHKTVKAYCSQLDRYYRYRVERRLQESDGAVQQYSLHLLDRGCSHAHVNQAISAIKFHAKRVLDQSVDVSYIRPKKEHKLPNVLSLEK